MFKRKYKTSENTENLQNNAFLPVHLQQYLSKKRVDVSLAKTLATTLIFFSFLSFKLTAAASCLTAHSTQFSCSLSQSVVCRSSSDRGEISKYFQHFTTDIIMYNEWCFWQHFFHICKIRLSGKAFWLQLSVFKFKTILQVKKNFKNYNCKHNNLTDLPKISPVFIQTTKHLNIEW